MGTRSASKQAPQRYHSQTRRGLRTRAQALKPDRDAEHGKTMSGSKTRRPELPRKLATISHRQQYPTKANASDAHCHRLHRGRSLRYARRSTARCQARHRDTQAAQKQRKGVVAVACEQPHTVGRHRARSGGSHCAHTYSSVHTIYMRTKYETHVILRPRSRLTASHARSRSMGGHPATSGKSRLNPRKSNLAVDAEAGEKGRSIIGLIEIHLEEHHHIRKKPVQKPTTTILEDDNISGPNRQHE